MGSNKSKSSKSEKENKISTSTPNITEGYKPKFFEDIPSTSDISILSEDKIEEKLPDENLGKNAAVGLILPKQGSNYLLLAVRCGNIYKYEDYNNLKSKQAIHDFKEILSDFIKLKKYNLYAVSLKESGAIVVFSHNIETETNINIITKIGTMCLGVYKILELSNENLISTNNKQIRLFIKDKDADAYTNFDKTFDHDGHIYHLLQSKNIIIAPQEHSGIIFFIDSDNLNLLAKLEKAVSTYSPQSFQLLSEGYLLMAGKFGLFVINVNVPEICTEICQDNNGSMIDISLEQDKGKYFLLLNYRGITINLYKKNGNEVIQLKTFTIKNDKIGWGIASVCPKNYVFVTADHYGLVRTWTADINNLLK